MLNPHFMIRAAGLLCFVLLALGNTIVTLNNHFQAVLWLAGVVLLLPRTAPHWRTLLPVVLVLAFGLRLLNLEHAIHRHVDELLSVGAVVSLRDDPRLLYPYQGVAAFPRLYSYWQAQAVPFFGATLTSLRVVSAVLGTLNVAALYLLAGTLFDRRTALLAALVLATFPPHLHFSRIGLNNVADPLFGTLALAFLLRGRVAAAGVMLGLTQYFYEGGRLLFPALILVAGVLRGLRWREWRDLLGMALVVAAPVYWTLIYHGLPLLPRLQATTPDALTLSGLLDNLAQSLTFFLRADGSWFYSGRFVLWWVVPLVLLGLLRGRWPIILWLLGAAVGNALLRDPLDAPRYVVVFPALALLIALGLRTIPLVRLRWVLVVLVVAGQGVYYFGVHTGAFMQANPGAVLMDDVRFRTVALPDNTHVRVITDEIIFDTDSVAYLRYVGRHEDGVFITHMRLNAFDPAMLDNLLPGRNHAFFIPPDNATLRRFFERSGQFVGPFTNGDDRYLLYLTPS